MARRFSNTEAKQLVASAEQLLEDLDLATSVPKRLRQRLTRNVDVVRNAKASDILAAIHVSRGVSANSCLTVVNEPAAPRLLDLDPESPVLVTDENGDAHSVSSCVNRVQAGCRVQLSTGKRDTGATSVVIAACAEASIDRLEQERSMLSDRLHRELEPLFDDVLTGSNSVRWLFSSRDKKDTAEKAYLQVKTILNEGDGARARRVLDDIQLLDSLSDETAWEWFDSDAASAMAVVERVCPGSVGGDDWPVSYRELCGAIKFARTLIDSLETRSAQPSGIDDAVKNAVTRCLSRDMLRALEKVPVEELNRIKRGIRVKALKEAGYENVAQTHVASTARLEGIRGISWQGACDIKKASAALAAEARKGLKIKLSADNKTPEATEVVRAGSLLVAWAKLKREALSLSQSIEDELQAVLPELEAGLKPLAWVFSNEQEKQRVEAGYKALIARNAGSKAKRVPGIIGEFEGLFAKGISGAEAWKAFEADPISIINALEEVVPDAIGSDDLLFGLPEELAREIQDECLFPDGLLCTLRRYQEMGVKYILHQERTLLGDEMGLGKTVQAIAAMVSLKNIGESHFVVVCPTSVLENWHREIEKHSLLRACKVHGPNAMRQFADWKDTGGVAVTTYGTAGKLTAGDDFEYGFAVVDEAHYIKNTGAARTLNTLKLIKGARRVCFMTGTALENKVDEMLTLIGFLRPDVAARATPLAFMSGAAMFRDAIAPVYYRRKREDVLTELPELIESEEWCVLGAAEEAAYEEAVLERSIMAARRVSWNVESLTENSSKAKRLLEIVDAAEDDGRKVLVFTFFLDTAAGVADLLGSRCAGVINGSVPPAARQEIIETFDDAPAGSALVAQIQSGGTGMNIQSASVVIFCEPQYKPSIENQAVSRAYRMGQTRNVLAFRLLCQDTVDERILEIIRKKQDIFDAFADKSTAAAAAAKEDIAVDNSSMGKIIEEEIERIKGKNSTAASDARRSAGESAVDMCMTGEQGVSVTRRISQIPQPHGGFINPRAMTVRRLGQGMDSLHTNENVHPSLVGSAVDYLTRLMTGAAAREAFRISELGAANVGKTKLFETLLHEISELEDDSVTAAVKLAGFDSAYRAGRQAYRPVEELMPDASTIENIRTMVKRSLAFFDIYGPVTLEGFDLEGGYTKTVAAGDGDFLTEDTLWDFKVSKHPVKKEHTLQLLMYWRMGLRSVHPEFKGIRRLGTYNPRRNEVSIIDTAEIPDDIIKSVERDIIRY